MELIGDLLSPYISLLNMRQFFTDYKGHELDNVDLKSSQFHSLMNDIVAYHLNEGTDFKHKPDDRFDRMTKRTLIRYFENISDEDATRVSAVLDTVMQTMNIVYKALSESVDCEIGSRFFGTTTEDKDFDKCKSMFKNTLYTDMHVVCYALFMGTKVIPDRLAERLQHQHSFRETGHTDILQQCGVVLRDNYKVCNPLKETGVTTVKDILGNPHRAVKGSSKLKSQKAVQLLTSFVKRIKIDWSSQSLTRSTTSSPSKSTASSSSPVKPMAMTLNRSPTRTTPVNSYSLNRSPRKSVL